MEKIIETSFDIIFIAGEARTACEQALTAMEQFAYDEAETYMEKANEQIIKAHTLHTEILQQYIESMENQPYYMIFSHAQDTLMTINSEILLAKHLLKLSRALYLKITE